MSAAYAVLLGAIGLTIVGMAYVQGNLRARDRLRFVSLTHRAEQRLQERVNTYTTMLRATDGLYAIHWPVLPDQFQTYVGRMNLRKNYPGVLGIGFSLRVAFDAAAFEDFIRTVEKRSVFKIRPATSSQDDRTAIVYLEPQDHANEQALGYDMYTDPTRRDAMRRARDEGVAAASGRVQLLQDEGISNPPSGFVFYLPVYGGPKIPATLEERRKTIRGWVYCPFRCNDLFGDLFAEEAKAGVMARVYDGTGENEENLLYASPGKRSASDGELTAGSGMVMDMAGRVWTLAFDPAPAFFAGPERYLPAATGVGGTLVSLVLFLLVRQQVNARLHAEEAGERIKRSEQAQREAREAAEQASRLKDEFLATVSHELRTPLNAILGWAQLLESSTDRDHDNDTRQGLETILRNARSQAQLIEDLLDVSRIVSGKLRLEARSVDLAQVIRSAEESVRLAADAKGVKIREELHTQQANVWGDPSRLQQIMWNLLTNSLKFTPRDGSIRITLDTDATEARMSVIDSGAGIDPEFLPFVFERFRQADGSITRKHGGLGLGLSIVRNLVELHGGTIHAASPGLGQGATFTVTLPLRSGAPAWAGEDGHSARHAGHSLHGLRILVVDDDPDARELVKRILSAQSAHIILAGSAADAMELFQSEQPIDILVGDLAMPGEDGFDLVRHIRALPPEKGGTVPAVAVSALARLEERDRALKAGYQVHLPKPVDAGALLRTVADLSKSR